MDASKFLGHDEGMEDIRNQAKLHFGKLVADGLKARGITQAEAGRQLGINPRSIAYWQQGQSFPTKEAQKGVENMLGWKQGALAEAIASVLSGAPLESFTPAWLAGKAEVPGLGDFADDDLGQELLGRLRNKDLEIRRLKAELSQAQRQLEDRSQPDFSLAAHGVEDSMRERWLRDEDGVGEAP